MGSKSKALNPKEPTKKKILRRINNQKILQKDKKQKGTKRIPIKAAFDGSEKSFQKTSRISQKQTQCSIFLKDLLKMSNCRIDNFDNKPKVIKFPHQNLLTVRSSSAFLNDSLRSLSSLEEETEERTRFNQYNSITGTSHNNGLFPLVRNLKIIVSTSLIYSILQNVSYKDSSELQLRLNLAEILVQHDNVDLEETLTSEDDTLLLSIRHWFENVRAPLVVRCVDLLTRHGSRVNARNKYGRTILCYSAQSLDSAIDVTRLLLSRGAHVIEPTEPTTAEEHIREKQSSAFHWLLTGIVRRLDRSLGQSFLTADCVALALSRDPRRMKKHVESCIMHQVKYVRNLAELFIKIKSLMKLYWERPIVLGSRGKQSPGFINFSSQYNQRKQNSTYSI